MIGMRNAATVADVAKAKPSPVVKRAAVKRVEAWLPDGSRAYVVVQVVRKPRLRYLYRCSSADGAARLVKDVTKMMSINPSQWVEVAAPTQKAV